MSTFISSRHPANLPLMSSQILLLCSEVERSIGTVLGTGAVPRPGQQMQYDFLSPSHALAHLYCYTNNSMASELSQLSYAWRWSHDVFPTQEGRLLSEYSTTPNSKVQRKNEINRKHLLVFIQACHVLPQPGERLKLVCIDEDKYQHRVNNHWHPKVF